MMILTKDWLMKNTMTSQMITKFNEDGLNSSTVIRQSTAPPDGNGIRNSPVEVNQLKIHENEGEAVGDPVRNQGEDPDLILRTSTTTIKAPDSFEHSAVLAVEVPETLEEAKESYNRKLWRQAAIVKPNFIEEREMWTKVALPPAKTVTQCNLVFKGKIDERGRVAPCRAWLVAKGFFQKEGIDDYRTFAALVPFESLLLLCGKYVSEG